MNPYITGALIRELREKHRMTQSDLAARLCVSDKTVSKWETGKGHPDISLLEPIAGVFGISLSELLSGSLAENKNTAGNMLRARFFVCPICGNAVFSTGELSLSCHGARLVPLPGQAPDGAHEVSVESVEDDLLVTLRHGMTKDHYISFVAALSSDRVQMVKLYPEGDAACRIPARGVERIVFYCNRDGLFSCPLPGR